MKFPTRGPAALTAIAACAALPLTACHPPVTEGTVVKRTHVAADHREDSGGKYRPEEYKIKVTDRNGNTSGWIELSPDIYARCTEGMWYSGECRKSQLTPQP
jgi:hypothetical protein